MRRGHGSGDESVDVQSLTPPPQHTDRVSGKGEVPGRGPVPKSPPPPSSGNLHGPLPNRTVDRKKAHDVLTDLFREWYQDDPKADATEVLRTLEAHGLIIVYSEDAR